MHHNEPQELLTGPRQDLTVILMHGRGRSPADMHLLAVRLGIPNVRFLFPEAEGHTWYPKLFQDPIADNEPSLSAALNHYDGIVETVLAAGTPLERIVVGGFSQGACLTAEFLARSPRRYGGVVLWTGGLIGPDGTDWPVRRVLAGVPVYLTTSEIDPWVPPQRVRETARWLRACGAAVELKIFDDRPHSVDDVEIDTARVLLEQTRAGAAASA